MRPGCPLPSSPLHLSFPTCDLGGHGDTLGSWQYGGHIAPVPGHLGLLPGPVVKGGVCQCWGDCPRHQGPCGDQAAPQYTNTQCHTRPHTPTPQTPQHLAPHPDTPQSLVVVVGQNGAL